MKKISKSLLAESNEDSQDNQGEGNVDAARRYNQSAKKFVDGGGVPGAARAAKPRNERDAAELLMAEKVGRSRARK